MSTARTALRAQVYFPSCWDGVNKDSADHKSHMAYPIGKYDNGVCPETHPVQLVSIFFEVIYQTGLFADRWHSPVHHPFVFAQGDRTGHGFHGDFVNGWNVTYLQQAVNECMDDSGNMSDCPVFDNELFTDDECQACKVPPSIGEQVTGNLTKLPGCNPVTNGPEYAPPQACDTTSISSPVQYFTSVITSLGWEYQGCANDSVSQRTLQGASTSAGDMTVQKCINYCKGQGYRLAGLEFASQCYCDNDYVDSSAAPQPSILGNCWQPCAGNAHQVRGGSSALSMYKNCDGGACNNVVSKVNGTVAGVAERAVGGIAGDKGKRHLHRHAHAHGLN
ncbi:hypothetical protein LTR08_004499 [Meristemomyces frigidus]|nr:hypothetical protein LTR08_004499 [Meristemomyces frigidus]